MKFLFYNTIFFFIFLNLSSANENIRFIDINYIVTNSAVGKNLSLVMDNKNKKITEELKVLGNQLKKKKEKIVSQKNILKKEEFEKLVREYDIEVKNYGEKRKMKNDEFNKFRINAQKKIIDLLNPIITSFLKEESIQILLQKEKIIFGDDNLDITKKILKIFDSKHKKIKFE